METLFKVSLGVLLLALLLMWLMGPALDGYERKYGKEHVIDKVLAAIVATSGLTFFGCVMYLAVLRP